MCGLSTSQTAFDAAHVEEAVQEQGRLREGGGDAPVTARKGGWSLPLYHELIVADAKSVNF
jgi:hypothetical protein